MKIQLLENATEIRNSFINTFVLSWDEFQVKQKDWIAEIAKNKYMIDINWYNQAYLWDKLNFDFSVATFSDALSALKTHVGKVLIMSEDGTLCCPSELFYNNEKVKNFVAQVDVKELAKLIEDEWYDSYKLAAQNMYNPDAVLPEDLYVFDESMTWLVVFTHETTDWEFDENNPMKQAETRYCIICK